MAIPANPFGAFSWVAPNMTKRNNAVSTTSAMSDCHGRISPQATAEEVADVRFLGISLMCLAALVIANPLLAWQLWVDNVVLGGISIIAAGYAAFKSQQ